MERQQVDVMTIPKRRGILQRAIDVGRAREKAEDIPRLRWQHPLQRHRHALARGIGNGQRVGEAGQADEGAVIEVRANGRRIHRRGHDDHAQVVTGTPCLCHQCQAQVRVQAPLVELVEHDRGHIAQQRILVQVVREHALGDDEHARGGGAAAVEPDMPPHVGTERPALFVGDPAGDGTGGDASRLKHEHTAGVGEVRRHARRLSGARLGGHDDGSMELERPTNVGHDSIDWQGRGRHVGYHGRKPPGVSAVRRSAASARLRETLGT